MFLEPLEPRRLLATPAPFQLSGTDVYPKDFRLTTFASGLNYPLGMAQLSDGSILVATSVPVEPGGYFGASVGQILRLYDTNNDGTADGSEVLATGLPPSLTDLRIAGNLVFVTSASDESSGVDPTITILALGSRVYRPLTKLATLTLDFPQPWEHYTYGLATRPTPGHPGSYDVFFNVGSQDDADTTPTSLTTTITSNDGLFTGVMKPDSIYKLTVTPGYRDRLTFSNLTQVAYGLRNAAGIAVDPATGDLYFQDNGINGGPDGDENPEIGADTLDMIPYSQIGNGSPPDFGFAHEYVSQSTGQEVGTGDAQHVVAYTAVDGSISEGAQDIAFTPASWPTGLNDGVVAGFYGMSTYNGNGLVNTENPVVYYDPATQQKLDLLGNDIAAIGHPTGLLSTANSLFVADLSPLNQFDPANNGVIYEITANPRVYTVSGIAFTDNNHDGVYDKGDTVQKYQTIFIDENGNGTYDPGIDREVTTNRFGYYSFTLPADRFVLRQVLPSGWSQTTAPYLVVRLGTAKGDVASSTNRNFGSVAETATGTPVPAALPDWKNLFADESQTVSWLE